MSMNSTVQKIFDKLRNLFSTDRKRPADQDNFSYPSNKFRRVGYDEDDEYSDTDMDDFLGNKGVNKRRTLNQKRQAVNHFNGFSASTPATNHRTNNDLPDDDLVLITDQAPCTKTVFVTRLKPFVVSDPAAHSTFRTDVPPLMPLSRTSLNGTMPRSNHLPSTSRYSFNPSSTMHNTTSYLKPPVPRSVPINKFRAMNGGASTSNFLSASMQKQNAGFKGIDTVERMSRGHRMVDMARNKSPPSGFSTSVFTVNREKNDKRQYYELLKQVCPDIYSKMNCTDLVDLTKEETVKNSSTKVDLTSEPEKDDSSKGARSVSPTDTVNTLLERLSCKPVFDDQLTSKYKKRLEEDAKHYKTRIQEEEQNLSKCRDETDEAMRGFRKRYHGLHVSVDQLIQRIDAGEDEEEEEEEVHYPALTQDHQKKIKCALYNGPAHEVIIEKFNLKITRNDLSTLVGMTWLNDEVINFYMNLIMERAEQRTDLPNAYCFNTFFIPTLMQRGHAGVRRWTRKVDVFSFDLLPVPVHVGNIHWCMAIIRMKDKVIQYYDSMGNPNQPVLDALERYLIDESMDKRKIALDTRDWVKESIRDCPQQRNGSDCGVFSCMNAEHLTRNAPLKFSQNEMPYFRQKMVLEIATGQLIT